MVNGLRISGRGGEITAQVLGYENPSADDISDANWLRCTVSAKVGRFSGTADVALTTQEISDLLAQLRALELNRGGTATLETYEDTLRLSFNLKATGVCLVTCTLKASAGNQVSFSFAMESDQTDLARFLRDLTEVAARFPVRQGERWGEPTG